MNDWIELTPGMYAELEGNYWLAMKWGTVLIGKYEWEQGGNPDGFTTTEGWRAYATEVTHIMAFKEPKHPNTD